MTSSEIQSNEENKTGDNQKNDESPGSCSSIELPLKGQLKVLEKMALVAAIGLIVMAVVIGGNLTIVAVSIAAVVMFIFLLIYNSELEKYEEEEYRKMQLKKGTEICSSHLLEDGENNREVKLLVPEALRYSQYLTIESKKKMSGNRRWYYSIQVVTIVLSGVTPIFVLLEKMGSDKLWLKWVPVILPAIVSMLASIATSFPLEENWTSAKKVIESLEAEEAKFILGTTEQYQTKKTDGCKESQTEKESQKVSTKVKVRKEIGKFVNKLNRIRLQQFEGEGEEDYKGK
ncbi:MAG: DUF4231 domain-containing protein [Hormoscilla sp.]